MIRTLLVANRGEIACRIFRTCRIMGIRTVAVYAAPDASLPFVREADIAVALGGSSATESYLVIDKILDAARRSGADAIHPGFGFLSENASFAQAVIDAGLTWVGPTPANIAAMGTKVEAKVLAVAAGVPVLPSAVVQGDDPSGWAAIATSVGYPVLVKASSGGGGRGMRIVVSATGLADAVIGARREALASFGDATVFVERYLPAPRHIEFQVFGDTHGNVIHLGERECSVQRRHQKIVEEAPSPVLGEEMRAKMAGAAVGLARAIGYVGAGTVEYLYDDTGGTPEFFFLEMNTRLQVEHPVTECLTGADLVQWQIDVANGLPLPLDQEQVERRGHAIEVRLYAEDPANGFLPTFGHLHTYEIGRTDSGLRYEHGVESESQITTFFDPMLAKVIAHAPTRIAAATRLADALSAMAIHGVVVNRDYLVAVLSDADFLAGSTTTAFVDTHPGLLSAGLSPAEELAHVAAVVVSSARSRHASNRWSFAPTGWRNVPSQRHEMTLCSGERSVRVDYEWPTAHADRVQLMIDGIDHSVRIVRHERAAGADDLTMDVDGLTRSVRVTSRGENVWANSSGGQSAWTVAPRFTPPAAGAAAGGPIAPVPGRVVAVHVVVGQTVAAGDALVTMEAMKMEHRIEANADGVIAEVLCAVGDQVDAHQVLVVLA